MTKRGAKIPMVFGMWSCVLAAAWGESTSLPELAAAIQAIEQAPDPSATVAAYVNGAAVDRNDPKLSEAYMIRMVDLGLPELAFHQAQTLTTLQSNNGLAWGVVAYVEARRGNMAEAISAINLAGQFAPTTPLVERTAGEIMAWYHIKADKATLSENAHRGLATIRRLLEKSPEFANAYETARKAYQAQTRAPEQAEPPETVSPSESENSYSDYSYVSDAGWVESTPWWWWQPVGFFAGSSFVPLTTVIVFSIATSDIAIVFSLIGGNVFLIVIRRAVSSMPANLTLGATAEAAGSSLGCLQRQIHRRVQSGERAFARLLCEPPGRRRGVVGRT